MPWCQFPRQTGTHGACVANGRKQALHRQVSFYSAAASPNAATTESTTTTMNKGVAAVGMAGVAVPPLPPQYPATPAATVPPPLKTNKRDDPEVSPSPSIEDLRGLVKARRKSKDRDGASKSPPVSPSPPASPAPPASPRIVIL